MAISVKTVSMMGVSLVGLVGGAVPALAQQPAVSGTQIEEAEQADGASTTSAEIVVTGSRLTGDPNRTAPSPIVSVTAEDLQKSGETNISEVLRELPALINSVPFSNSFEGSTSLGSDPGLSTLNLRGLGANRTLVLVNGRRHVSGAVGQQAVDISSIPSALIERVDVLTGGASSIYGADAVTGVVNFLLKRKFEGIDVRSQVGIAEKGDGRTFLLEGVWGKNFAEGRGNFVVAAGYENIQELREGDREFSRGNARPFPLANPARSFQRGEITTASTPNFAKFYGYGYGPTIPTSAAAFLQAYAAKFAGSPAPTLTSAELALITRAQSSPPMALSYDPRGGSSLLGVLSRADGQPFNVDLNGNGIPDCQDSWRGFNNNRCLVTTAGGGVRVFQDGDIIIGPTLQSGGDGSPLQNEYRTIAPGVERFNINLLGSFEFSSAAELFGEFKFVRSDVTSHETYFALTNGVRLLPDNPFIPAVLKGEAQAAGGLILRRDQMSDLGPNAAIETRRDTYRGVVGLRGELTPHLRYEVAGVYGRTEMQESRPKGFSDRFFASLDVVTGPNGQPVCRSSVNAAALPPGDPFNGQPGFASFKPGDGSCVPVNPFNGADIFSQAARDWILTRTLDKYSLEQHVVTAQVNADTGAFFNLPGGPLRLAVGAEYRNEKSATDYDPLTLGLLPVDSPAGKAGTPSPVNYFFQGHTANQSGSYNVREVFGEVEAPLLSDRPFFHELTIGGAVRYSDYGGGASGVGNTFAWSANAVYAPVRDLRLRGTYSKAIRAPNISELFDSLTDTLFFQIKDPCVAEQIALLPANDPRRANRIANCAAAGIPANFVQDTGAIKGQQGGNQGLHEETAKTFTVGAVLEPRFLPNLSVSVDYYDIRIKGAIGAVDPQDVVNNCYNGSSLNNQFCANISRDTNSSSPLFRNINFIRSGQVNFGRLETSGIDVSLGYRFRVGENQFSLRGTVNWIDELNNFFDPADPTLVDVRLQEAGAPEWSGLGSATYSRGPVSLTYRLQYVGKVAIPGQDAELVETLFGPENAYERERFIHDLSASIDVDDRFTFYGGVNNLTDVAPYSILLSYPINGVGRFFYVGARAKF